MIRRSIAACIIVFLLWLQHEYASSQEHCISCHANEKLHIRLPNGLIRSLYVNPDRFASSVHGKFKCTDCHTNMRPMKKSHQITMNSPLSGYRRDIPNEIKPFVRRAYRLSQPALAACIECHKEHFKLYSKSEHAMSILSGSDDPPMCTDCHGSHYILSNEDPRSLIYPSNVIWVCAKCHANKEMMLRHKVNTHTVTTYLGSFHGKKLHLGSKRSANCVTCHGYHSILSPSDPASMMHPSKRSLLCANCHEGGGEKFALTFTHKLASPSERPAVYWVNLLFELFVIIVLISMFAYTLLDAVVMGALWCARAIHKEGEELKGYVQRWNVHQILQHFLFMGSVMALMLTGLPLKGFWSPISLFLLELLGGVDNAAIIHRVAGIVMLIAVVYHLLYLLVQFALGNRRTEMLPTFKDFVDFYHSILFLLRIRREPPKMGRYNFVEKFLYWAAGWGILMMGVTGIMLWQAPLVAERTSPQLVEIAHALHSHEAVLATFALLCFHIYFAHLRPDVFPMSTVWLTGKISLRELKERHALEYEHRSTNS
ncbi:MAG: cytochrome c3 family protein [Armatimonadota bacterium]|nr:cytochrome c3 family protein [Armatimonadota bacterium]MCX7778255.1 cytochrome c3 family protein [Armatimonadota bacterium]MDW8025493.1 cytochrome c3 family protein [Armatimonadota bacterium]